uniref:Uncharacterized protein n=1 Tax=Arundo donax TaxID=35708 RepID=A0A0A9D2T9_ARUDO
MSPDPFKIRLDKLSIEYLNAQIRVHMKSWRPSQVDAVLQSESCRRESLSRFIFSIVYRCGCIDGFDVLVSRWEQIISRLCSTED